MIAETSRQAYSELKESGKVLTQSNSIVECIEQRVLSCDYKTQGGLSRRQIAKLLGMDKSTVAARVNKLIKDNLLESTGVFKDPVTNVSVGLVRLPRSEVQLELI